MNKRNPPRLAVAISTAVLIAACAGTERENIVDPVNAPTIEMSAPVLDGGTVLVAWRYLSEA